MNTHGYSIIAGARSTQPGSKFQSRRRSDGTTIGSPITTATAADVNSACSEAEAAFLIYRFRPVSERAALLRAIADEIEQQRTEILEAAEAETGYQRPRIEGEFGRTVGQLRFFASVVDGGLYNGAVIDHPAASAKPGTPDSFDVRKRAIPRGPVAVFAASNFPLAFSVAGGDTASALAAGCSVVCKAHSAHPVTSELVADCINRAIVKTGQHPGLFSLLQGHDQAMNIGLVQHPKIKAVGFTGSRAGGDALVAAANSRRVPIPVFAEMSSINPNFLAASALTAATAKALFDSNTLGAGQFCTNPGVIFVTAGEAAEAFIAELAGHYKQTSPQVMLTDGIASAYGKGIERLVKAGAEIVAQGSGEVTTGCGVPTLLWVDSARFGPNLTEEVFGASMLVVLCDSPTEMIELANQLENQLTATLWGSKEELNSTEFMDLRSVLELKVGRLIEDQAPTGVRVCHAQVHGGDYPASTAQTSVGADAIRRFQREIAYQNVPAERLPAELQDTGRKTPAIVDGRFELASPPPTA